jgi:hypothetical protein
LAAVYQALKPRDDLVYLLLSGLSILRIAAGVEVLLHVVDGEVDTNVGGIRVAVARAIKRL